MTPLWDLLISNILYPSTDDFRIWSIGDLAVAEPWIVEIGQELPRRARRCLDGSGMIAIPGLHNMHTHGHDMLWRGAREGAGVDRQWPGWFWDTYNTVSTETCTTAATAAYVSSLRGGVTFVADHLRRTLEGPPFVEALSAVGLPGTVFASRPYGESSPLSLPHETAPAFEAALEQAARLPRRPVMIHAQETPHRLEEPSGGPDVRPWSCSMSMVSFTSGPSSYISVRTPTPISSLPPLGEPGWWLRRRPR